MYKKKRSINSWLLLLSLCLLACSQDVDTLLPGPADAAVNFYNASEVLNAVDSLRRNNYVFIDDSTAPYPPRFDQFRNDQREYPALRGVMEPGGSYTLIDYMRLPAGSHRLMFTGKDGIGLLADTTMDLRTGTFTCLYLVESAAHDSAYRLVTAPEDRQAPAPGKVGIRIINLCPDVDTFKCFRRDADGNIVTAGMPQNLTPGAVSAYMELDTAAALREKVFISFFTGNNMESPLITAAVPAESGRSFALLIQGYQGYAQRRIPTRRNADGSLYYGTAYLSPKLRVNIRATY